MSLDREFKSWQQEWQSEATPLPDLRQRVRQQSRFMWIMLAFEAAVTVGVGGGFSIWAWRSRQTDITVLAACAWGFIAVAWWFAIANRRRSWRAPAETTQAYLELTIRRCRGALSAIRFGFFLYFAEIVFCVAWLFRHNPRKARTPRWSSSPPPGWWVCTRSAPHLWPPCSGIERSAGRNWLLCFGCRRRSRRGRSWVEFPRDIAGTACVPPDGGRISRRPDHPPVLAPGGCASTCAGK